MVGLPLLSPSIRLDMAGLCSIGLAGCELSTPRANALPFV